MIAFTAKIWSGLKYSLAKLVICKQASTGGGLTVIHSCVEELAVARKHHILAAAAAHETLHLEKPSLKDSAGGRLVDSALCLLQPISFLTINAWPCLPRCVIREHSIITTVIHILPLSFVDHMCVCIFS